MLHCISLNPYRRLEILVAVLIFCRSSLLLNLLRNSEFGSRFSYIFLSPLRRFSHLSWIAKVTTLVILASIWRFFLTSTIPASILTSWPSFDVFLAFVVPFLVQAPTLMDGEDYSSTCGSSFGPWLLALAKLSVWGISLLRLTHIYWTFLDTTPILRKHILIPRKPFSILLLQISLILNEQASSPDWGFFRRVAYFFDYHF